MATSAASSQLHLFALGSQATGSNEPPDPGSIETLERIIAELLPATIPTDLMLRRGAEARRIWALLATSPLYEALTDLGHGGVARAAAWSGSTRWSARPLRPHLGARRALDDVGA